MAGGSVLTPNYALSSQTVIFYDWDETLFPTTEICDRWGLKADQVHDFKSSLSYEQLEDLEEWRDALFELLCRTCELTKKCVILTNSKRPWVDDCIQIFAPKLMQLFDQPGGPEIVYAHEHVSAQSRRLESVSACKPGKQFTADEWALEQTFSKYVAMKDKVTEFYSKYSGQTWKNILSFGDMPYEYHAVQDVTFRRKPPRAKREKIRTKSFLLPSNPTASAIALRLRFHEAVLPFYVQYDGDISLDLTRESDPLEAIGKALDLPELSPFSAFSPLPLTSPLQDHQWGLGRKPSKEEVQSELAMVKQMVSTKLSL